MWFALFDAEDTKEELIAKSPTFYKIGLYSKDTLLLIIL